MSKSERMSGDLFNLKDMSFEATFTMDEEGMRGLAKFLKELDDETLDAIFSGKQELIIHDPKRGEAELRRVVRCKDCKHEKTCCRNIIDDPDGVPEQINYCSYGERKEQENE